MDFSLSKQIAELKEKLAKRTSEKDALYGRLKEVETVWTQIVTKMVDGINDRFSSFFKAIDCEGCVLLSK